MSSSVRVLREPQTEEETGRAVHMALWTGIWGAPGPLDRQGLGGSYWEKGLEAAHWDFKKACVYLSWFGER